MTNSLTTPKYIHDCEYCQYVKSGDYLGRYVDFYVCGENTVLYRDGNEIWMNGAVDFKGKDEFYINAYSDLYRILQEFKQK